MIPWISIELNVTKDVLQQDKQFKFHLKISYLCFSNSAVVSRIIL